MVFLTKNKIVRW